MRRLTTTRLFPVLLIVAACVALNVFAYVLYRKNREIDRAGSWIHHTYVVMTCAQSLFTGQQDMVSGQRGYLLSGKKEFLDLYAAGRGRADRALKDLESLTVDNAAQQARVARYRRLIEAQREITDRQLRVFDDEPLARGTVQPDDIIETKRLMDRIRHLSGEIMVDERRLLEIRNAREERFQAGYRATILLSSAISIFGLMGGTFLVISVTRKRERAERELESSNERFALAIDGMQDGLFDYRYHLGDLYFSPRLKEMIGETDASMSNSLEEIESRIHPDDLDQTRVDFEKLRRREVRSYVSTFRVRHRLGGWRWILARGAGIWADDGELKRLVGAYTDITELREREESLKRINSELETFTYIASHDLRSPLVNLKGFAGEMKLGIDEIEPLIDGIMDKLGTDDRAVLHRVLREEIPDCLRFIQSSVVKMDRLTNAILELSRIGRHDLKRVPVDVAGIVQATLDALKHQLDRKGVRVCVGELPILHSDPVLVEQVIGNIIDNAVKYLDPLRPGKIEVEGESMGESNLYRVRDNGRGIAAGDMHKVFEIFRRAGNNEGIEGDGMGMAYVRATARRLGGSIHFESTLGEGTTFFITFRNFPPETRSAA